MNWKLNKPFIIPMSLEQIEDYKLFEKLVENHIVKEIQNLIDIEDENLENEIMHGTGEDEPLGILRMSDIK